MTQSLRNIEENTIPGAGITVNFIYVNPRAMAWQVPLLQKLRTEGVPIEGMTIGAGVPSLEVANEYIETIGLKHIAFKPGSLDGIQQVINIAKANPHFPVVLQWTGGRGGGHHSFEDFHQPILQMYGRIRRCENIVLVAGSGFGGAEDTYPYLTGTWSEKYQYPPMPFDGFLFGSRMMIAKEAHTSLNVSYQSPSVLPEQPLMPLFRPKKQSAKLQVWMTRTGKKPTKDLQVVYSPSVLRWASLSTSLPLVAFSFGMPSYHFHSLSSN